MNLAACFIVIFINKGLKESDGDLAIGAFGIVNRIVFLFVMIVMGLNQGMQPIAGYTFGAQQYHRVNPVSYTHLHIRAPFISTPIKFLSEYIPPSPTAVSYTHLEKADENLRYAKLGFMEGVIPTSNVLEAQTAWLSSCV